MKQKISFLSKTIIMLIAMFFTVNVYAETAPTYDGSTSMKNGGYNYLNLKKGKYVIY